MEMIQCTSSKIGTSSVVIPLGVDTPKLREDAKKLMNGNDKVHPYLECTQEVKVRCVVLPL